MHTPTQLVVLESLNDRYSDEVQNLSTVVTVDSRLPVEFQFCFQGDTVHLALQHERFVSIAKAYAYLSRTNLNQLSGASPHWFHAIGDEPTPEYVQAVTVLVQSMPTHVFMDLWPTGNVLVDEALEIFGVSELALKARLCMIEQLFENAL